MSKNALARRDKPASPEDAGRRLILSNLGCARRRNQTALPQSVTPSVLPNFKGVPSVGAKKGMVSIAVRVRAAGAPGTVSVWFCILFDSWEPLLFKAIAMILLAPASSVVRRRRFQVPTPSVLAP